MKFNGKSLVKSVILSSILGISGMCFGDIAMGSEAVADIGAVEIEFRPANVRGGGFRSEKETAQCLICLEEMDHRNSNVTLLGCGHYCHENCLKMWLRRSPSCPVCKSGSRSMKDVNLAQCAECKKVAEVPTSSGNALCLECAKRTVNSGNKYNLDKRDARNINRLLPDSEQLSESKFKDVVINNEAQNNNRELQASNEVQRQNKMLQMCLGSDDEIKKLNGKYGADSKVVSYAGEERSYRAVGYLLNDEADRLWETNTMDLSRWNDIVQEANDAAFAAEVAENNKNDAIANANNAEPAVTKI